MKERGHAPFPTALCLVDAYCLLLTAHCLLFTVHCSLFTADFPDFDDFTAESFEQLLDTGMLFGHFTQTLLFPALLVLRSYRRVIVCIVDREPEPDFPARNLLAHLAQNLCAISFCQRIAQVLRLWRKHGAQLVAFDSQVACAIQCSYQ